MKTKNGLDIEIELHRNVLAITKADGWKIEEVSGVLSHLANLPGEKPVEEISKEKANDAMPQL